jgi:hypothetical protein
MKIKNLFFSILAFCFFIVSSNVSFAQGTAFTYQGQLTGSSGLETGLYDMTFQLWTANTGGSQVGTTLTSTATPVTNGLFTVILDFGSVYNGTPYWLQLTVRSNNTATYYPLTPRQELTPAPYAVTAENVVGLVNASQLSGTLPAGLLSGGYPDALSLNNAGNVLGGNGSGLTGLNASQLATGTVSASRLPSDVAYTDASQNFTGDNTFSGSGAFFLITNDVESIYTAAFTGLSLQYNTPTGEGAILSSYNSLGYSGSGFLTFYTKQAGNPVLEQVMIDYYGGVAIDQQNANGGILNNGTTNGVGLTFGITSGEGIASQRQPGLNQYGLDFYTSFNHRMSILNDGNVGIGTTNPGAQLEVDSTNTLSGANSIYGLITSTNPGSFSTAVRGQNNGIYGLGIGVYGSQAGGGWGVYGTSVSGYGVYGDSGSGTGVYAYSSTGSALTIGNGAIHVTGAGIGTSTAAFIWVTAKANIVNENGSRINNPLCNGDPNAIIYAVHNLTPNGNYNNHPIGVWYDGTGWQIFNEDEAAMATNIAFNVLIIKN